MNPRTERFTLAGPAGTIEGAFDAASGPGAGERPLALVLHPHPLHGGTLDNKVVQTLARAFVALGFDALRFNFRGVGGSAGTWDEGRGELDDALAVLAARRVPGRPLVLAGFSFGAFVASRVAQRLAEGTAPGGAASRLVLVGAAASRFDVAPVPADTLVIHGEADDVVPLSAVLDWARPQSLPVWVLPGAGHFFHGALPQLKAMVMSAFAPAALSIPHTA
jgi:alpha/beta superfamily hydrolase